MDVRDFAPAPSSVRDVRTFVEGHLGTGDSRTEDAVWLASELATNAVLHARSQFQVSVETAGDALRVSVVDHSPGVPTMTGEDTAATSGRGISIVEAVADSWGVDHHQDGTKTVWFQLRQRP